MEVTVKTDEDFDGVIKGARAAVHASIKSGVDAGRDAAQDLVQSQAASRGYDLSVQMASSRRGDVGKYFTASAESIKWGMDPFFLRFFEYGTHHIEPMPFMRPAARVMEAAFLREMENLESEIRRRVRVRRV
jgi:hypothetical protein